MSEDEVAIVKCGSTAGPFKLRLVRKWSPHGYDRAVELFRRGFYNNTHFFRAMNNFLVQFGITYSDDEELRTFARSQIPDDPQLDPRIKFRPGIISFAGGGKDSRKLDAASAGDQLDIVELLRTPSGTTRAQTSDGGWVTATTNGETVSDIVTELREIYTVHNPTKLPGLPALSSKNPT